MQGLERFLIYYDKSDLNEYLDDNLLYKELYMAYIANKDNCYNWKHSAVDTYNEVYFQCTRAFNDPHPEDQMYERYLNDARDTLGTRYASDMIFAMVNALFTIMENKPNNVVYFLAELQARYKNDKCFFPQYAQFAQDFIAKHGQISLTFPYMPISADSLFLFSDSDWVQATHDFDEYHIRQLVNRYKTTDDKLELIKNIENAFIATTPVEVPLPFDLPF